MSKPFHGNNGGIKNTLFSLYIKFADLETGSDWRIQKFTICSDSSLNH